MMMHDFHYKNHELYCESVRVVDIARKVGTPFYLYSYKTFTEHLLKLVHAFRATKPLICYSMKANSNLAVLRALVKKGSGLDIVSGGELFRARKVGCPASKIVYAGVGKTDSEISEAIRAGIFLFNVESRPELARIQVCAKRLKRKVNVSLRVNPHVNPRTHRYIATGRKSSKFGMDLHTAFLVFVHASEYPNLQLNGVHVHIGSQIVRSDPFVKAFKKVLSFIDDLDRHGCKIKYLNIGGGLGIIYSNERPQTADEFAKKVTPLFKGRKLKIVLEPGRFIAGNSGIFVTQTLYVKKTPAKNFAIVDGAMNDLVRPSLYDSFHEIWPLTTNGSGDARRRYDIVGPICESGDYLAKNRVLKPLKQGDLIAFASAGAYGFTMSSNYNARPRVPEVMVRGKRFAVIRDRESRKDLIRGERIPKWV